LLKSEGKILKTITAAPLDYTGFGRGFSRIFEVVKIGKTSRELVESDDWRGIKKTG
jgi:hypothetical protein